MLKRVIDKLQPNVEDTNKTALKKAVGEGLLEGLVIVGAIHFVAGILGIKK